ncbi:uncharacterized protein CANTADRAFT_45433 [Suhomyces tanzawaensis NRRL Y-17324]|uniref:Ubiquitin-like domain-containing protein n=1 Tax=Suhomyces tanzawaensis NRRL Y-17324 TaxID=984487 RepID=A0A1E4SQ47_9ASCO|nr:uncharacterized protein CANTADRAFT_45433 [Suhomyces tanzawaensis NRRL Y-17324]ODV81630.1 hypothetical protein CANTADRAFT_45433 [Suhomyces tanzawaensis NRRL Y-17324]
MSDEKKFVETFLQLIALADDTAADQFNSTSDYGKIESLGPSLPKLDFDFPKPKQAEDGETKIAVAFKSIKPPYKFSSLVDNVPVSYSIYKLKGDLIETTPVLKEAGVEPANLKFMFKSKVLLDTSILSSLPTLENVSIMVMVSAPEAKPAAPVQAEAADADPEVSEPVVIGAATWAKIHKVLQEDLGAKAQEALEKLQSKWE